MAMQTKTIKQKMKSVANIGKITKAMEMISVSKMKKAVSKRSNSLLFAKESFALLENLHVHKHVSHPYLETGTGDKVLMLVVASNKGLCGGYNMNVSKQVSEFVKAHPDTTVDIIAVGRQAQKVATRNGLNLIASFDDFSEYYTAAEVRSLLHTLFNHFDGGEYREVKIAYTEFISSIAYSAKTASLMPLSITESANLLSDKDVEDRKKQFAMYVFEPSEQEVLNTVVPATLMTVLYQHLLESKASEHSSRVTAMKNASDNAAELGEELRINFNRARQAAITQEIAEIVGGSSAVS
ncbi:MAG: ATP synthase F1 subunit gamma [Minisyncoccia bacterium]